MMRRLAFLLVVSLAAASQGAELLDPAESLARIQLAAQRGEVISCPHCNLRGADLSHRNLTNANFNGADLSRADFTGSTLDGASFIRASAAGARFEGASLLPTSRGAVNFAHAGLAGAAFARARARGAVFLFADVHSTDFSAADVSGALFNPKPLAFPRRRLLRSSASSVVCGRADLSRLAKRVYVSPSGVDGPTCGTAPGDGACLTIAAGIVRCDVAHCGVLVEWGEYQLTAPLALKDGVNVYGGCVPAGTPSAQSLYSSILAAGDGTPAVSAQNLAGPVLFQNFEIGGSPADDGAGHASIAVALENVQQLTFADDSIVAGRGGANRAGADGADGATGGSANGSDPGSGGGQRGGAGSLEMNVSVTGDNSCTPQCATPGCAGENGSGSAGARGGQPGQAICDECAQRDDLTPANNGGDGAGAENAPCANNSAPPRAATYGLFSAHPLQWRPTDDVSNGDDGRDGPGGGGGGAGGFRGGHFCDPIRMRGTLVAVAGNRAGGGGAGGERGHGGGSGGHGGGSFAIALSASHITLERTRVYGGLSGAGGHGGKGGGGGAGGNGAAGNSNASAIHYADRSGTGGSGGHGGGGGAGGGGAGGNSGPSLLIALIAGSSVAENGVAYYMGAAGSAGPGGTWGYNPAANPCAGVPGSAGNGGPIGQNGVF